MSRDLPHGWTRKCLGDLMDFQNGYAFKPEDWRTTGLPIVRIQNLNGGNDFNYYDGFVPDKFAVKSGDILFCWSGSRGTSFGPRRWQNGDGWLNQHIFRCDFGPSIDGDFAFFLLEHLTCRIEQEAHGGAGLVHIKKSELVKFETIVPPHLEQRRIAEILSSVNEAVQATQAVIEQTRAVNQGTLKRLLTKGISHTEFKHTEIGEIPSEWDVVSLGDLLRSGDLIGIQDGNHGERHPKTSDYVETGIPFVMARDLVDGTVDLDGSSKISKQQADSLRIGRSLPGDVLLTHKGTVGRVAITPEVPFYVMLTPQVTYYRVSKNGRLDRNFLATVFMGSQFQKALQVGSDQTTRKYIGITDQKRLLIPLPKLDEQIEISSKIQSIAAAEGAVAAQLAQMQVVKASLTSDLLTGRKRVSANLPMAAE